MATVSPPVYRQPGSILALGLARRVTAPNAIQRHHIDTFTAYVLTRSAYCSARTCKRLRTAMQDSIQLDQDVGWSARLYSYVAKVTQCDVALADVETTFRFRWALVAGDDGMFSDPYFSRVLEGEITTSFRNMLTGINGACKSLPGLNPAELSRGGDEDAWAAINTLYNRMGHMLITPGVTQQSLLALVAQTRNELADSAVEKQMQRLTYQARGICALQAVCATVNEGRMQDLAMQLDQEHDNIAYIAQYPPAAFESELRQLGVPLAELQAYLFPVVAERWNGAICEMSMGRWAATYYHQVSQACISTLAELRKQSNVGASWHGYAGIALWQQNHHLVRTAIDTGGFGAVVQFPHVSHTHMMQGHVIAATATSQLTALRVVRICAIVHEIVALGLLRPRVVRADFILPLISRFQCEATVRRDMAIGDEDCDDAMDMDAVSESGASIASSALLPLPALPAPAVASSSTSGNSTLHVALHGASLVPKSLLRDYVLLVVAREVLSHATYVQERGPETDDEARSAPMELRGYMGIANVCERLTQIPNLGEPVTPMIERFSKASLSMTIGHVFKDKLVGALNLPPDELQYVSVPSWVGGTKGVSFNRTGGGKLMAYLHTVIQKMQPPTGPVFANEWHTSRSAKSHARRKQLPQVVPVGPSVLT